MPPTLSSMPLSEPQGPARERRNRYMTEPSPSVNPTVARPYRAGLPSRPNRPLRQIETDPRPVSRCPALRLPQLLRPGPAMARRRVTICAVLPPGVAQPNYSAGDDVTVWSLEFALAGRPR